MAPPPLLCPACGTPLPEDMECLVCQKEAEGDEGTFEFRPDVAPIEKDEDE